MRLVTTTQQARQFRETFGPDIAALIAQHSSGIGVLHRTSQRQDEEIARLRRRLDAHEARIVAAQCDAARLQALGLGGRLWWLLTGRVR